MELGPLWSFLQDGANWFVLGEWDGNPAMVVVDARPLSRVQASGIHQRLLKGYHLIQLLQLPLLPRQLVIHDSNTPRRAQLPPSLLALFVLPANLAPLLYGSVFAPAAASASAGAPATTAAPAAASCTSF